MRAEFQRRRDAFVAGLNTIKGFSCRLPKGAFYVFPNITKTGWKSKKLADALLEQAGVACLVGDGVWGLWRRISAVQRGELAGEFEQGLARVDEWTKKNL